MAKMVEAVYEKGVLKLLEEADLREGERVKVIIMRSARGFNDAVKRLAKEYRDVREDPLRVLLEERR